MSTVKLITIIRLSVLFRVPRKLLKSRSTVPASSFDLQVQFLEDVIAAEENRHSAPTDTRNWIIIEWKKPENNDPPGDRCEIRQRHSQSRSLERTMLADDYATDRRNGMNITIRTVVPIPTTPQPHPYSWSFFRELRWNLTFCWEVTTKLSAYYARYSPNGCEKTATVKMIPH